MRWRASSAASAIIWLRTHFREMCRIEDAAGVSRMSPIAFRTQLRLQEARRLMVGEGMDAANAGFQVGYGSPSQSSRDYVRLFGCPPASHAARLRADAGVPPFP